MAKLSVKIKYAVLSGARCFLRPIGIGQHDGMLAANLRSHAYMALMLCCLFMTLNVQGAKLPFTGSVSGAAVQVTTPTPVSFVAIEDQFASLPGTPGFVNTAIKNTVWVGVDHSSTVYVNTAYSYRFKLRVETWNNNVVLPTGTTDIYLYLQYDPLATTDFRDKSIYSFTGANKVKVSILEIYNLNTSAFITNPPDNIIVKSDMEIERYFTFTTSAPLCPTHSAADLNGDAVNDQLTVSWSMITGAEEYDLEWTYVDNYGSTLGTPIGVSSIAWNFIGNSTRVTTKNTFYKINLVYDRGYIIYRYRGVGRLTATPSVYVYGTWSKDNAGTNPSAGTCPGSYYQVGEHSGTMNWQYSSTFAEEGKKKEVVGYYDGSLRNRQTVTINNTDNNAIAGESYYDYQGRKAVDALPVPTGNSALGYNPNFNVNVSLNRYSKLDFDVDGGTTCASTAGPMSNTKGSSKYYSANNPNNTGNNAYIPDAQQYPFSQVEYTPDNTGRIRRMGGVGQTHQLNGKETKYYYGQPTQWELDRLFGSEVGYNSHYKKNMVVDPNGQISISYLDMHGRVVATALSGGSPTNVVSLGTNTPVIYTADLLAKDAIGNSLNNVESAYYNAITFNTQLLVSSPGNHTLNYSLTMPQFTDSCLTAGICFDCIYDLQIIVRDECGSIVYQSALTKVGSPAFNTSCGSALVFPSAPSPVVMNLGVGNYQISKVLTINEEAYNYYLSQYLNPANNSCIKTLAQLETEEKALLNYSDCDYTCDRCVALLGSKDEYVISGRGTEAEWQEAYNTCTEPCRELSPCEVLYTGMLADMAPGGQYAEWYDSTINAIAVKNFPLSVLNWDNVLPDNYLPSSNASASYWRNPMLKDGVTVGYYEEDLVTRSKVYVQKQTDGSYVPPVVNPAYVYGTAGVEQYTYPEYLQNLEDFISRWKHSWAHSLVKYHPEYCYHKWCVDNIDGKTTAGALKSFEFDELLNNTATYADAVAKGLITGSNTDLVDQDPYFTYFNMQSGDNQKTRMTGLMNLYKSIGINNYTMKNVAALTAKCGTFYGTNFASGCTTFGTGTTAELDNMWTTYKAFYLSYKQDLIRNAADDYTLTSGCKGFNACIGVKDYNAFATRANGTMSTFWGSGNQPCSYNTYSLYQSKQKRFLFGDHSLEKISADQSGFTYFYNTGKCPKERGMMDFLSEIAAKAQLASTNDLHSYKSYTPDLYTLITGSAPGGTFITYETVPTISGVGNSKLRIDFRLKTTSTLSSCAVKFEFITNPAPKGWADIVGLANVQLDHQDNVSGSNVYNLIALLDHDGSMATPPINLPIKMSACASLGSCEFYDQCLLTDYAKNLQLLMSGLAAGNQLTTGTTISPINLETSYNKYLTRHLRNEVGGITYTNLRWKYNSGVFTLYDPTTLPAGNNINLTINGYSGYTGSFTHANLPSIKYFENIRIKPADVGHGFLIDAWYDVSGTLYKVTLDISVSNGMIANCYDPIPLQCDIPELQAARDLERLLASMVVPKPTVSKQINGSNLYTSLLESYIGKAGYTIITPPLYTTDRLTSYIIAAKSSTPGDTIRNKCKFELFRINDAYEKINDFNNITMLSNLKANDLKMVDGKTFYFTIDATFPNGTVETIGGYTSCIPLADCGCPLKGPVSCPNNYKATIDLVKRYNTNNTGTNPNSFVLESMPAFTSYDCKCGQSYFDYLNAYTNTAVAPLSYKEYVKQICSPKGYFCPEYAMYLDAIDAYNAKYAGGPVQPITPILYASGFPCSCVKEYLQYIQSYNELSSPPPAMPPMDIKTFSLPPTSCSLPGPTGDACSVLLSSYTSFYTAKVNAFNATVLPGGAMLPGAPLPINSLGVNDCICLMRYISLLEKYMSNGMASPGIMAGFPAAPSFAAFKSNFCAGPCISEYFIYAETMQNAGLSYAMFDNSKCGCYLYYVNYFQEESEDGPFMGVDFDTYYNQNCAGMLLMSGGGEGEGEYYEMDTLLVEEGIPGDSMQMESLAMIDMNGYVYMTKQRVPCCPQDTVMFPTATLTNGCYDYLDAIAGLNASIRFKIQNAYFTARFREKYLAKCLKPLEDLTLQMPSQDYQYTLYYYDQGGNLVRTVPPAGVQLITNSTDLAQVITDRTNDDRDVFTTHGLLTTYEYNSLNQLTRQAIPDNTLMDRWMVYNNSTGIPGTTTITDTRFIDANVGYMIGNGTYGTEIYRTTNGGRNYNRVNIETSDMSKLQMIDANNGFGIGAGGMFFVTSDGGVNWRLVQVSNGSTPITTALNDLYFKDASNGIVVGDNGVCYRASLSGTWSFYPSATSLGTKNVLSVSFSSSTLGYIAVDNAGVSEIHKITTWPSSGTTGFTLSNVNLASNTRGVTVSKVYMINSTTGFASGWDGQLMKTVDGGATWKHISTGITWVLRDVYFVDANNGLTLATDGKFYATKNGGSTWTLVSTLGIYNAMHIYDKTSSTKKGYAAGDNGVVATISYDATNGFRVFKLGLFNPTTNKLYTVFGLNSTTFFIGSLDRYLAKVELVGSDWKLTDITTTLTGHVVLKIYFSSATLGMIITNTGKLYQVSYSGSWTYTDMTGAYYYKDYDFNATTLYLFSNVSGTATWLTTPVSTLVSPTFLNSSSAAEASNLTNFSLIAGGSDYITNGVTGSLGRRISGTLTFVPSMTQPLLLKAIKAVSATNTVYAAGDDGTFLKSTDAGVTWQSIVTGTSNALNAMDAPGVSEVYIAGNNGTMVKYTSSSALLTTGTSQHLRSVVKYNSTYVAAGGDNKILVVSSNSGTSFSKVTLPVNIKSTASVKGLSANGANLFLSGNSGLMYKYSSGTYTNGYNVTENSNQIRFNTKKQLGIIVGDKATVVTTVNNGQSWQLRPVLGTSNGINLKTAWIFSNTSILVAGNSTWCRLWNSTTNALTTPTGLTATGSVTFKDVSFNNKGKGILISDESLANNVSYSNSSGAAFTLSHLSSATLNSLDIEGPTGYIVGNSNKVYCYDIPASGTTLGSPAISSTTVTGASNYMKVVLLDRVIGYIVGTNGQVVKMKRTGTGPGSLGFAAEFSNTGGTNTANTLYATHYNKRGSLVLAGASGYVRTVEDDAQTISNLFWYDELGRPIVTQNSKQFAYATKAYSYTQFDALGRITQLGEVTNSTGPESNLVGSQLQQSGTNIWIGTGTRREVSSTYYDNAFAPGGAPITQINLRKRVASITFEQTYDGNNSTYDHASHYTYDIHGNIDLLVQDIPALSTYGSRYKTIKYDYDLISGKVNSVYFNAGQMDQYQHKYTYDAENRLTYVETSRDNIHWDNDAKYFYYSHGPLMRTEIGDNKLQGIDFAYTLHGWIKGVNAGILSSAKDMGHDGQASTTNQYVAKDAFGYILGYYQGDHTAINSSGANHFSPTTTSSDLMNFRYDLYNGNITTMQTVLPNCSTYNASKTIISETFGNAYQYDQLNRLKSSRTFTNLNTGTNTWGMTGVVSQNYSTDYSYDANGNITNLTRWGNGIQMDQFSYNYDIQGGRLISNKLYDVDDPTPVGNYADDIDDQGSFTSATSGNINTANNYSYDELGNLIKDVKEEISSIEWSVQGKIKKVNRIVGSARPMLEFTYDAFGNRLTKKVTPSSGPVKTYYYLRDEQGNEMRRYVQFTNGLDVYLIGEDQDIYGMTRLGVNIRKDTLYKNTVQNVSYNYVFRLSGLKQYELSNHLGNVLTTVVDQKKPNSVGGITIDNFDPVILSISDYYPYGNAIPAREYSAKAYRYGFNGQEKDDEVANEGDYNTATFWEYDTRLGKRWNLDPKAQINISDYGCFGNNPILYADILGDSKSSRHLDPDGKLIVEYDDGDKNTYKHQTARTKEDVDKWRKKFNNTSGNGILWNPATVNIPTTDNTPGTSSNSVTNPGQKPKAIDAAGKSLSYTPAPRTLPGFPDAERIRSKGGRTRWRFPDGTIGEWDGQHGEIERYDPRGKHIGVWDADGNQTKDPVPGRRIDPISSIPSTPNWIKPAHPWAITAAAISAVLIWEVFSRAIPARNAIPL